MADESDAGGSVLIAALVDPPCPVAVSPRGHTGLSRPMRRIGVAVDGSAQAAAALRWARELADEHDCIRELRLLAADSAAHDRAPTSICSSSARTVRGRLSRRLHDSVSADLARSARCPVVAVPFTRDA
jgi:nucleotide-binding universal stress UspA family protein